MFQVLLVEDNCIQRTALQRLLQKTYNNFRITTASDYETSMISMESTEFHLFILDIQFDTEINGIDLAKNIRKIDRYLNTPIIFITALPDRIFTAINDIHCYGYIKKPYCDNDIIQTVDSLFNTPIFQNISFELNDVNGIFFRINLPDIIYVKLSAHNCYFFTLMGNYNVSSYTLKNCSSDVLSHLTRCHKSYYVNMQHIISYDRTTQFLSIQNGDIKIPVGRKYKDILLPEERDD